MHPVLIAARLVVRDMGGPAEAAKHLGLSVHTLNHQLNPNDTANKLGMLDGVTLTQASGDPRLVAAVAAECGGMYVPLPTADGAVGGGTMEHVTKLVGDFGALLREVADSTADNVVNDNELAQVQTQCLHLMAALQGLLVHLARVNQSGKPPVLRAA